MPKNVNLAQDWPLRNDQIVLMALGGVKQREIGEVFGLSHQQISLIIRDDRAKEIIEITRAKLRKNLTKGIEDELTLMAQASLKVLKKTLDADMGATHRAKPNQDRVAVAILRGRGFLREEGREEGSALQVPEEQFAKFMEAMQKAGRVREIDPFEGQEVLEAEVVEVGDGSDNQPI